METGQSPCFSMHAKQPTPGRDSANLCHKVLLSQELGHQQGGGGACWGYEGLRRNCVHIRLSLFGLLGGGVDRY